MAGLRSCDSAGYKDRELSSAGVPKIGYSISQGGARVSVTGKNESAKGQPALPTGLSAALSGQVAPVIQLVTSDEVCFEALLEEVKVDTGLRYKALSR